jgi:hypothetical protein
MEYRKKVWTGELGTGFAAAMRISPPICDMRELDGGYDFEKHPSLFSEANIKDYGNK